jgi:hypothetical protein
MVTTPVAWNQVPHISHSSDETRRYQHGFERTPPHLIFIATGFTGHHAE